MIKLLLRHIAFRHPDFFQTYGYDLNNLKKFPIDNGHFSD